MATLLRVFVVAVALVAPSAYVTPLRRLAPARTGRGGSTPLRMTATTERIEKRIASDAPPSRPPVISDAVDMVGLDDVFDDDDEPMTLDVEDGKASQNPIGYAVDAFTAGIFSMLHRASRRVPRSAARFFPAPPRARADPRACVSS